MSSPARSTRSSRASTPTGADSPAIESPRSRLQKLLARFDEDSDEDEPLSRPLARTTTTSLAQPTNATRIKVASQDEEDDEPVSKPMGRLAARMAGVAPPIQEESSDSSDEDVYQRIRRDLMASKKTPATEKTSTETKTTGATPKPDSPHTSPARKRLLNRAQRASTPASIRSGSPGLFMSPGPDPSQKSHSDQEERDSEDSDSDLPDNPTDSNRLRELVERRRAERLAKERAEQEAAEERAESGQAPLSDLFQDEDTRDEHTERRLTQQARPTRKASKKALEDMNRETQRIKRNMQLTHQAKVKKRFTPQDFLSAFNRPKQASTLANVTNAADMTSSSPPPAPSSDAGVDKERDTPPSSPPAEHDDLQKVAQAPPVDISDDELPTLEEAMTQPQPQPRVDKGKAPMRDLPERSLRKFNMPSRPVSTDDDDDDLEIIHNRFAMFDEAPKTRAPEERTMLMLRHLAHLTNQDKPRLKKGQKPSITPAQLEIQLRQRAREIANQERAERLAELRAKGVVIMTEEEREQEQMQIEDMLSRAREEADKLRKKEKASAKAAGEVDAFGDSDESGDEDYVGSGDEAEIEDQDEAEEPDLSASENENDAETDNEDGLIDNEAGEDAQEDVEAGQGISNGQADHDMSEEDEVSAPTVRRARRRHVIEDDDEEDDTTCPQKQAQPSSTGINDELAAAFGFGPTTTAPLGMTQMFAGTMAESQTQGDSQEADYEQNSLDMLRHIPSAPMPSLSIFEDSQDAIGESQYDATQTQTKDPIQQIDFNLAHSTTNSPSVRRMSQFSEIPDPSQDVGFAADGTPLRKSAISQSTVDTVMLGVPESPVVQRRGRLLRRSEVDHESSDTVPSSVPTTEAVPSDAFSLMRQAAKKPAQPEFDKQKSNAKTMVDEQAEESEDEYAGIGGASDDEDGGSGDEADKQMIDESEVNVDERKLAALYAEKARAENEAQTSKLYKDLMSGALRRKRGAGAFELDSDEDEQIVERRRRKQREEARKRKLLLQDEFVGKLGGNDKKEAFLRAIEDRDELDDGPDYLDGHELDKDESQEATQASQPTASQPTDQAQEAPLSQVSVNTLKRGPDNTASQDMAPPPPKKSTSLRRNNQWDTFRKPKSLAEVRESVSFLIDDVNNEDSAAMVYLTDSEHEEETTATERAPASARRVPAKPDIIDRLTLKKQSSTSASTVPDSSLETQAFTSNSSFRSFKPPPSLLRKATSLSNENNSFSAPTLGREDSSTVRNGGSKKSSINYQAREAERAKILEKAKRKRDDNVRKIAGLRRKAGGGALGALGRGGSDSFES